MSVTDLAAARRARRMGAGEGDISGGRARPNAAARSREFTRQSLLKSGRELFAEHGLHSVTTHDIAHSAGVAAGTFYLHFKNKQELFRELVGEAIASMRDELQRAVRSAGDGPAAVRAHAEAVIRFSEMNRELILMVFSGGVDAAAVESDVLDQLAASIAEARTASGRIPEDCDADVLSQALVGMYARVVLWWAEDPTRVAREHVIDTLTRIQLAGTLPRQPD